MYFLLYLSTAVELFSDKELHSLLSVSRTNNQAKDITGMLLYNDGAFMQILEGHEEVVKTLYQKVEADNRHFGVLKILEGPIEKRYFEQWSMGFRKLSNSQWQRNPGMMQIGPKELSFSDSPGVNKDMLTFIRSFCLVNFR